MTKRGIYPGSFSPVHRGHIEFATGVLEACRLDEVDFAPERLPRDKPEIVPFEHRAALLGHATSGIPRLGIIMFRSVRFTVAQTLPELRGRFPDDELTLLVGSDVAKTFDFRWDGLGALLGEVSIAIGMRGGDNPDEMNVRMRALQQAYSIDFTYTIIDTNYPHYSSTSIRSGELPGMEGLDNAPTMRTYIDEHGLYPDMQVPDSP